MTFPLWQRALLLALGYFLCAWLGSQLSAPDSTNVTFWLPAGLFVAVLLLNPTRHWLWLALAVFPAAVAFEISRGLNSSPVLILFFYFSNVVRSVFGAWLVRRFVAETPTLANLREFWGFMGLAGILSAALGATFGVLALWGLGLGRLQFSSWCTWWTGSAMAVLVFSPLLLTWLGRSKEPSTASFSIMRKLEAGLLFGGMSLLAWYFLVWGHGVNSPKVPLLIFILWAGLRFGVRGASLAIFWLALLMAYLTTHYLTGLSKDEIASGNYLVTMQVFLAVGAFVGLIPAIILADHDRTTVRLRESEERLHNLTAAAFEGIFISEDGRILDVNDQGLKMFGYDRREMIGKEILELVTPAFRATVSEAIIKKMESIYGHQLVRQDGSVFFAEARSKHVKLGERVLRMTALRDITERKRAEEALRVSEESLRATIENTPYVAVQWYDLQGRVTFWNHASENMYGWSAPEALGKTLDELILTPEQSAEFLKELLSLEQAGKSFGPVEYPFRNRSGKSGTVLSTLFKIHIPSGEPRFVCMDVDLTRRKHAEALTRAQMQVLEMIAAGRPLQETLETLLRMVEMQSVEMLCSILLLDADGVHIRHIAAPSLSAEFLKQIDGSAIGSNSGSCGTAIFRREPVFVADIASDPLWAHYKTLALANGLRACWSTPIFDSQRNVLGTFAIYYRSPGLPDENHCQLIEMATHTAAICIGKHRTEFEHEQSVAREQQSRIDYTLQLIASQEAERKRIAAELHDSMGQNLLLIKNLAQMAARAQVPAQAYEHAITINNLATQCIAEARQISRDLHPYQLDHLGLKRALEGMLETTAQASEIQFTWKIEEVGDIFPAEALMNLYRILQESLNNILKHSRARNVRVDLECDIHEVHLRITDDGCGFNPDSQGVKKRGLGLKNISERVRMLGGKLTLESAPEKGTQLAATIPLPAAVT